MRCANCGAQKIYAERPPAVNEFVYHEVITLTGIELRIDYKLKNRRLVRAFSKNPEVSIQALGDELVLNGPQNSEVVVNFTLGRT